MDLGIAGRVALVTAASKGLGRAAAMALAAEGCKVVVCARGEDALATTVAELKDMGADVVGSVGDVTRPHVPAELVQATVDVMGGIDILVANSGGPPPGHAFDVTDEALETALNANLLTSVRLARSALPHMRANRWGRICFITSYTVKQPSPVLALSNTARTGLWAWAKTAAQDVAADGITVNLACPGPHDTERMRALGGGQIMGAPEDFGSVVAFLCSEPASFITGTALQVDGGATTGLL